MRKLFKFLLSFVIVIVLLLSVFVGFLIYQLSDKTDGTPNDIYGEDITLHNEFTKIFNSRFDLENKDYIDLTLTDEEINKIIFSYIRENINDKYLPSGNCATKECKYIKTVPVDFLPGKQSVIVKSAYVEIENDVLSVYVNLKLLGINTRAKVILSVTSDNDNYYLNFDTIGLGKLNVLSGFVRDIIEKVIDQSIINDTLTKENIPATVDFENNKVIISKAKIGDLFKAGINKDDNDSSAFIDLLTSEENDLINFGMFDNRLGFRFSLEKFKVNQDVLELGDITNYDEDVFIKNKVQNFVFVNLANQKKITFSDMEFNQLIYNKTEGYEDFITTIILPSSESTITLSVIGIKISFGNVVEIRVNVDINGLKTSILIKGNVVNNDSEKVEIKLNEIVTIGQDIDESENKYIKANINLIIDNLSDSLNEFGLLSYSDGSFFLESENFNTLMMLDDNNTPLEVERLKIVDGFLEVYVNISDDDINNDLNTVINEFKNLPTDLFDLSDFSDEDLANEFINEYQDFLDDFDNPDKLIESINKLSNEDQNKIFEKIENSINLEELNRLYDSIFGK